MQMRPLGASGIQASAIGFGAWAIGGWMWGGSDESDSIAAVHAALDAGINLIDTAPIYGFGRSEEIVGKALRDRRHRAVLATKCGMVCDPTRGELKFRSDVAGPNPNGHISIHVFCGPPSIRREVEASLRRLGTDYLDLYQTHWQESTTPIEDTMDALLRLKEEGKIRAVGVCNATSSQMERYRRAGQLDSDQERFSMLDRGIELDQLPYCREHGLAVLAYSPLGQGLLTGKVGPERKFSESDQRHRDPRFSVENRKRVIAVLERCRPLAEDLGVSLAQLVIAWTVHQPGLTHALVGARNAQQAQENAAAGDVVLTDEQLHALSEAVEDRAGAIV